MHAIVVSIEVLVKSLFFLFISFVSLCGHSQTLKVAFGEARPPYIIQEKGALSGIELDVVKEALLLGGYKVNTVQFPTKRLMLAVEKMGYDIAVGVDSKDSKYFYSDEYIELKNFAVTKSYKNIRLESIDVLKNYSVGAWPFAWQQCGDKFKSLFTPNKDGSFPSRYYEPLTAEGQNKMFWKDRFDVSISNKMTFMYYQNFLGDSINTKLDIVYNDIFPEKLKYFVAFKDEKVRNDFNNGLAKLRRNKRYNRIFDYYIRL